MATQILLSSAKAILLSGAAAILVAGSGGTTPPPDPEDFTPASLPVYSSFPTAVDLKTMDATAAQSGEVVRFGMAFGWGDVPAGHRVTAHYQGTKLTVQQDGERMFKVGGQDFSLAVATLTVRLPAGIGGNAFMANALMIGSEPGAPDRTPCQTTTSLLAAVPDLRMVYTGGTLGSATYAVSLTDILQNGPNRPWPTSPTRGWQVMASGPNRLTIWAFGYLRNTATGNVHAWAHGWFRVTMTVDGKVDCEFCEPLRLGCWSGPISPTGDFVGSDLTRCPMVAAKVELRNGSTVLVANMAGSPITVPAGGVVNNGIAVLDPWNGAAFQFSGSLPSGLSASAVYFACHDSTPCYMMSRRLTPKDSSNSSYVTTIGAASSSFTATPLCATFLRQSYIHADTKARPVRIVGGARPTVLAFHDVDYITRRAAICPPIDKNLVMATRAGGDGSGFTYNGLRPFIGRWDINGPGADADDNRIGYLSNAATSLLFKSAPAIDWLNVMQDALTASQYALLYDDERAGPNRPMPFNNGRLDDGTPYPELGPLNPGYNSETSNAPVGPAIGHHGGLAFLNGDARYMWFDNSHMPSPQIMFWLKSGQEIGWEIMLYQGLRCGQRWMDKRPWDMGDRQWYETEGRRSVYGVIWSFTDQARSNAWGWRICDTAHLIVPDWHPGRPVLERMHEDNEIVLDWTTQRKAFPGTSRATQFDPLANLTPGAYPDGMKTLGLLANAGYEGQGGKESIWMNMFQIAVLATAARRGSAASYRAALYKRRFLDILDPAHGGCPYFHNMNDMWWSADKSGNRNGPYRYGLDVWRPDDGTYVETGTCPSSTNFATGDRELNQSGQYFLPSMSSKNRGVACNSYVAITRYAVRALLDMGVTDLQAFYDDLLARIAVLNPSGIDWTPVPSGRTEEFNAPSFAAPAS